ncbi:transcription-silencing protein Clr2-domain-containing protein [Aspergillus candidus]|uniref:Transcription-silencing protein Clr2-domain-containing protein n=1 Tax=Aspergillus candidus TaxID=41067 RepID=A0A2I2F6J8_ASPCN|nr:transcription-silencing protein Clr2-domain-containing protein [Aspergillus candidus]PLB36272.1 transcription-silencing protein Clr2-domain-containing protein [Aspergillus candidus]
MTSGEPGIVDKEGTPDVFKMAVAELRKRGSLSTAIKEASSMDWRAERPRLDEYLEKLDMQPAYLPRVGELALWTTGFEGELAWNPTTKSIQIYSPTDGQYHGTPEWRAGVVGQVPEEEVMLQDLVETAPKSSGINYSGFRVETFPDPLSMDKSYSLHYRYVPLKCIKPFNAYEIFLQGIPRTQLHPSIEYAMTIMSSFSLLDKYHFQGTWPDASISCRGIFIGAELLAIGDAVRLHTPSVDIMVIDTINLHLTNCIEDPTSPQLAEEYKVRISGKVYAKHASKSRHDIHPQPLNPDQVADVFQTLGMTDHGSWYRVHEGKTITVSQDMIIGRCYEPDALQLLFGTLDCTLDVAGVLKARAYSRQVDHRIAEGKTWFWGDFRTQTLAIDSLNGEDVGHYSETRDVKMWRANLKIIDGDANPVDMRMAKIPGDPGRPSKPKSSFAEVGKLSKLVSTGLGGTDVSNTVSEAEEGSGQGMYGEDEGEGEGEEGEEEMNEEDQEEFVARLDQLRGGTEESEGGDWVPESKRPKHV